MLVAKVSVDLMHLLRDKPGNGVRGTYEIYRWRTKQTQQGLMAQLLKLRESKAH